MWVKIIPQQKKNPIKGNFLEFLLKMGKKMCPRSCHFWEKFIPWPWILPTNVSAWRWQWYQRTDVPVLKAHSRDSGSASPATSVPKHLQIWSFPSKTIKIEMKPSGSSSWGSRSPQEGQCLGRRPWLYINSGLRRFLRHARSTWGSTQRGHHHPWASVGLGPLPSKHPRGSAHGRRQSGILILPITRAQLSLQVFSRRAAKPPIKPIFFLSLFSFLITQ